MTKRILYPASALVGAFTALTVLRSYASIEPVQWAALIFILALSCALYALLDNDRYLKGRDIKIFAVLSVYAVTGAVSFYSTAGDMFRSDDWFILMLFNNIDSYSLDTLREISFFEMFGHIRFQPLAHLIMFSRYLVFGNNLFLYHSLNIFLHIMTGFMVFLVVFSVIRNMKYSFLFGLLFITLPSQLDTGAWTYHIYIIIGTILILAAVYTVNRYSVTGSFNHLLSALGMGLLSILLYEPALLSLVSLFLIILGFYLSGKGSIQKSDFLKIAVLIAAVYAVYGGLALYGYYATKAKHTISLSSMAGAGSIATGVQVLFTDIWESLFLKNIGITPFVKIKDILYLKLEPGVYSDFWNIGKIGIGVLIISLARINRSNRFLAATLVLTGVSYLFIISMGRLITNEPDYVPSQSRYQYFPNAMLLTAFATLLWTKFQQKYYRPLITVILFSIFFWNTQNTLYANNEIARALEPMDAHYHRIREFIKDNPEALVLLDFRPDSKGKFDLGSDMALDFLFKGNTTRFTSRATHVYDGRVFTENPYRFPPGPVLGDFSIEWRYIRDKRFGPRKDVVVVGSERVYPRISITPDNFIKVELKNAVTDIIDSYKLAYPPPPVNLNKTWVGATVRVVKAGSELILYFNGSVMDSVTLSSVYKNWERDGIDLYGGYYSGAGESVYIQDMHIHADQGRS